MINLEKIIIESKSMECALIEKGFKEDKITFFITKDIQVELNSFISKALDMKIELSKKFMGHNLHTIEGENTVYIGVKINE